MVVCPCGVMVPAAGVGRARRGLRAPTGCFDTTATVTTQPKEPQDTPASVEKLAAAAAATADPSGIPRPLSRTSKNKGGSTSKLSDEIRGDLSRTTLALATTESGRYVGTRPIRSNRSPTPTLHRLPQKTSRDHSANGGRPSKHLPAVRTSPTSPLDNQATGASRGSKLKGPTALPRNNSLNHRMNDLNSNQRRLLTQYLWSDEKHLSLSKRQPRSIPSSANPATKTFNNDTAISSYERIYENFPQTHQANESTIYQDTGRVLHTQPPPPPPPQEFSDDVTARKMDSSADSLTSEESTVTSEESTVTSEESTVWLSDSWKYNTIKKAPEFNIFEFLDLDLQSETEKDETKKRKTKEISNKKEETVRNREIRVDKVKKKIRSRLPMFGWKSDKENKGNAESAIKTFRTPEQQVLKPDNKWTQKTPDVVTRPKSIHKSQIEKPLTDNAYLGSKGSREKDSSTKISREKDPNFCPPENGRGGVLKSPITYRIRKQYTYMQDHERSRSSKSPVAKSPTKVTTESEATAIEQRHRCDNVSSSSSSRGDAPPPSRGSPLISPGSLSLRPSQMPHAPRTSQLPSPPPSRRQVSPKTHGRVSSFEKVPVGHSPSSTSSPYSLPSPSSSSSSLSSAASSSTSLRYLEDPNEEIIQYEPERSRISTSSSSSSSSARPLKKSQGDEFPTRMHNHSSLPLPYLTERDGNDTMNKQTNQQTNIRLPHILPSKTELKSGSRFTAPCLKSTDMRLQEGVSSETSYRTTSTREGRKRNMVEEEKEENEEEEEEREERTSSPPPFSSASSCMSQETKGAAGPPVSCREKVKRWKQNISRGGSSRKDWKESSPSRYPARPLPPVPFLPSPTLSCPPLLDERCNIIPSQYHSLPQLHSDTRDCSPRHHHPPRRSNRINPASFQPYYVGDLYKISPYEASRSRRYSQTSLIDQALESLESLSPSSYASEALNTYSNLSPISKRYSQVAASEHHMQDGNLQMPSSDTRQVKMSETPSRDCPWESNSTRSAMSPVLPPLPVGILDDDSPPSSQKQENKSTSPESPTKLASICILSLDLTVDCEEFSGNGFNLVSIKNDTQCDQGVAEVKSNNEEIADEELLTVGFNDEVESKDEDTGSVKSLSIDDKYYENDDYDSTEENSCDFLSEEQQRQLDESIALLSERRDDEGYDNLASEEEAKNVTDNDEDNDEITCDVQPMEALKRPLVYGYGSGPVRNLQGPSFLEKRLSQASDMSEYLEMDLAEAPYKTGTTEVRKKSESCMNLRETYWDYWQAKKGAGGNSAHHSSSSGNSSRTCSPGLTNCPSERFCYDPEVLLAHVRCPKSLEDATFKQYSAYVKSHIYDYFGNVNEALNDYGLSNVHRDWICSEPELLPDASRHCSKSGNPPLDYSSEPELSNGGGRDSPYGISPYQYAMRAPPPRPPPLHSKDPSQDSGTWTYLQSPEGLAPGFSTRGAYPVPLPRSTSSLSHVGPGTYNPWYHFLPDVTPPRTPRHSLYYTSTTPVSASRSASPSPSRGSLTSLTSALETTKASPMAHHTSKHVPKPALTQTTSHTSSRTSSKRSFLPNFSKVVRSPLRKPVFRSKTLEVEDSMDVVPELPIVHPSIQNRTHTTTSSKSSSSSSSSSSASSKDSVTTVIPATARNKGPNWLMRHFGGARSKMTAV